MRIKSYSCTRFAGIRDVELEFEHGLNVILGPNESGKSTIVDGIHSTLFKNIKLSGSVGADKDFRYKFMPQPNGDFIDGNVVIASSMGDYMISKEWGSNRSIELLNPDGNIVKDKVEIGKILDEVLIHGENTYSNIVFAKQRDLKQALHNILEDGDLNREVNDLLRKTLMQLDGISLDTIEDNIEGELEELYKRWNRDKNYPENNRGINDPYKVGLGSIVKSYYEKEDLKIKMRQADSSEREYEEISNRLKEFKEKKEKTQLKKDKLEEIEEDVISRESIELRILSLNKDVQALKKANSDWPRSEMILEQLEAEIKQIEEKKNKLMEEKKNLVIWEKKKDIKEKLESIEKIEEDIQELEEEIKKIPSISKEDISRLNKIKDKLSTLETTMEAGKMIGKLKKSKDNSLYISKDFGEEEILEVDREFQANGIINIRYGEEFEIQIQTGEIDFDKLNREYIDLKGEYEDKLEDLNIDSLEMGKTNLEALEVLKTKNKDFKRDMEYILDINTKEELKSEIQDMEDIRETRSIETIEEVLEEIRKDELKAFTNIKIEESKIDNWKSEYEDIDNLFILVGEKGVVLRDEEKKLEVLKPLPEEYETTEEFKEDLRSIRESLKEYQIEYEQLIESSYRAQGNLLDISYEELEKEYIEAEKAFNRYINRGEKLLKIRDVFLETKEKLSKDPMEPLVKEFIRLLDIATAGSYSRGSVDEDFNIKIENQNGEMPIELLSAGTYDAVTLALRFSLLKHIFEDGNGYVILDDCLVDLDPVRKKQSIQLINEFAKEYQIIFTTCDPNTAEMLGGNLIEL